MKNILELKNVRLVYQTLNDETEAVNGLSFTVKEGEKYHLRWFTPECEIDLCGHATLPSAYVIMRFYDEAESVTFATMSGDLTVRKNAGLYAMNFPAYDLKPVTVTPAMTAAIGFTPECAFMGRDLLCVMNDESQVRECRPDMSKVVWLCAVEVSSVRPHASSSCAVWVPPVVTLTLSLAGLG